MKTLTHGHDPAKYKDKKDKKDSDKKDKKAKNLDESERTEVIDGMMEALEYVKPR